MSETPEWTGRIVYGEETLDALRSEIERLRDERRQTNRLLDRANRLLADCDMSIPCFTDGRHDRLFNRIGKWAADYAEARRKTSATDRDAQEGGK